VKSDIFIKTDRRSSDMSEKPTFQELVKKATDRKTGTIDGLALGGGFLTRLGNGCDVREGPCSCGAWH